MRAGLVERCVSSSTVSWVCIRGVMRSDLAREETQYLHAIGIMECLSRNCYCFSCICSLNFTRATTKYICEHLCECTSCRGATCFPYCTVHANNCTKYVGAAGSYSDRPGHSYRQLDFHPRCATLPAIFYVNGIQMGFYYFNLHAHLSH